MQSEKQATPASDMVGGTYVVAEGNKAHRGHRATIVGPSKRWPATDMRVRCECGQEWDSGKTILHRRLSGENI